MNKVLQSPDSLIDDYIAGFPAAVQDLLEQIRLTIRAAAPGAGEAIKYGMPTFTFKGNLVYFAAFKNHIGFYATPGGNIAFNDDLAGYKIGKGSIQFPLDQPLPLALITQMVIFRVEENSRKTEAKKQKQSTQTGV